MVEGGDALYPVSSWFSGNRELPLCFMQPNDGISFITEVNEVSSIYPFLLHEFNRVEGTRADENEENAPIAFSVISGCDVRRPLRTEGRRSANDPMDVGIRQDCERAVAWIEAAHMARIWTEQTFRIIGEIEGVVPQRIRAESVVVRSRSREPAARHYASAQTF